MGLGSSCLEKVLIPYANSPSTNPSSKERLIIPYYVKGPIKYGGLTKNASPESSESVESLYFFCKCNVYFRLCKNKVKDRLVFCLYKG